MTMSVVMYKRLGISNTDIALYTSWLYLPWVLKPLWSPLVDITRTKRFWIVTMQFLVSFGLALVAFSVQGSAFFKWSLFLFWIMAFASATHDIAADGFYMLSLSKHEQTWWVGMRSTFYRTAMIVGSGLLVVLAGVLESRNGLPPADISVRAKAGSETSVRPNPAEFEFTAQPGPLRIVAHPGTVEITFAPLTADEAKVFIELARAWNMAQGFLEQTNVASNRAGTSWWSANIGGFISSAWKQVVSGPLTGFLGRYFGKEVHKRSAVAGNVGVLYLGLSGKPASGQKVAVNLERVKSGLEYIGLAKGDKGFRLAEGDRVVFTAGNWDRPAMAVFQLDPKLRAECRVSFQATSGNIPLAWSITLFVVAALFLAFSCWHSAMLPRPANDGPVVTNRNLVGEFVSTLGSFFKKPGVLMALAFILLYRFDEAQLMKVVSPFLLDQREAGGLGLTTSQVGLAYGTFGVLALTCGGLAGGFLAARHGLKNAAHHGLLHSPAQTRVCVPLLHPAGKFPGHLRRVAVEQFGYGFGFTAFMLYMIYFADGPHKTAHYAICTGFMALGMMLPGMWSGWLADLIGYRHFFVWVICAAIPGFMLAMLLKVDPEFGKKAGLTQEGRLEPRTDSRRSPYLLAQTAPKRR